MAENTPYMNPTVPADAHGSHADQAIRELSNQQSDDQATLSASTGHHHSQGGGGRTLNVPKALPENTVPGPSYNGAITTGAPCQGGHCSIPVTPTDGNFIHANLASANPPPGANLSYPGTTHLGNNHNQMPGINNYQGTALNHGPFAIQTGAGTGSLSSGNYQYIADPARNKRVPLMSQRGLKILRKYLRQTR